MPARLSPQQAAERLQPSDTLGIPLGTGQPAALLEALGERDDWEELRVYGALLLVWSELFKHPRVHYAEMRGGQHAFDLIPSWRTIPVLDAVERYLATVRASAQARSVAR